MKYKTKKNHIRLGVNIDHVATLRQARGGVDPDPLDAALACARANADSITAHLREDRRHIQDKDIKTIKKNIPLPLNLEMALSKEIIDFALMIKPHSVCVVPEKRLELTTEGGLDAIKSKTKLKDFIPQAHKKGIMVSLFIDPDPKQVKIAAMLGADAIELHTGTYSAFDSDQDMQRHIYDVLASSALLASELGLELHAGHGLNYNNIPLITSLPGLKELNIGHSIISRAVFVGIEKAVREMICLINKG